MIVDRFEIIDAIERGLTERADDAGWYCAVVFVAMHIADLYEHIARLERDNAQATANLTAVQEKCTEQREAIGRLKFELELARIVVKALARKRHAEAVAEEEGRLP